MKLYNPTLETIFGGFDGRRYVIDPGKYISVTEETGKWILIKANNLRRGLVDISLPADAADKKKKFDSKLHIVQRSMDGITAYIDMLHERLNSFIELDTELKQENVYGTILKKKEVKQQTKLLETATALLKDLEKKYGVSIAKRDYEESTNRIIDSIDATVAMFDADEERQKQAKAQEAEVDQIIKDMLPPEIGNVRDLGASLA